MYLSLRLGLGLDLGADLRPLNPSLKRLAVQIDSVYESIFVHKI